MAPYTRLRQVCLVAHDLARVVDDLCAVFAVEVCHRDPNVAKYGLVNALMPFGTSFIEVVSPIVPGLATAAGRYLARRGGDGGYMVINDCDDVGRYRARAQNLGIRIVEDRCYEGKADLLQLHPRDTGGAILEFDNHVGGEALDGAYHWAGKDWQRYVRTTRVSGIEGVAMQSTDPLALARRWGKIFARDPVLLDGASSLATDNATLWFGAAKDARGDGLVTIAVGVTDVPTIIAAARERSLVVSPDQSSIEICGVRFRLHST